MYPREHIGGKNGRFWAKHPNYFGREQKFWYPLIRKPLRHLVRIVLLVGLGIKWIRKAKIWPKMIKKCQYWATFGRFCAQRPTFNESKSKFWYPYNRRSTQAPCLHCFIGRASDQMGPKCQFLAQNASFGPKMAVFGQCQNLPPTLEISSQNFVTLVANFGPKLKP